MGVIFSRFRKKRTPLQLLEQIENKISSIENFQQVTEHRQKKIVGHLILYSVALYIVTALVFYFYFFPASLRDRLFYIIPLLIFPIIVVILKKLVTWYYKRQITNNEEKLLDLKSEKKQILDNVMEKETFKVAKEILEKFAPDQLRKNMPLPVSPIGRKPIQPVKPSNELQPFNASVNPAGSLSVLPVQHSSPTRQVTPNANGGTNTSNGGSFPQRLQLARPILSRDRSNIDKLVEYLVGDGPNNRYALICKNCSSHNGMALKEEILFIAFRCCYCGYMNPARQLRPQAPRLDMKPTTPENLLISGLNSGESEAETDEEEEIMGSGDKERVETNLEERKSDEPISRSSDNESNKDEEDSDEVKKSLQEPEKSEDEKKVD